MNPARLSAPLKLVAGVFLVGLLGLGAVLYFRQETNPVFRGKKLSEWRTQYQAADAARRDEAADALRHIGTNQASHLARLIRARDSSVKGDIFYFLNLQSWKKFETASDKQARGYFEIEMLGPGAVAMIPILTDILSRGDKPADAAQALAKIGPQAVPALRLALQSTNRLVRAAAAGALGEFGVRGDRYVPLLLIALQDRDSVVRANAALSLGEIHQGATEVVPALIGRLSDPDLAVRRYTARALGEFHEQAANAVPNLLQSAKSLDTVVRDNAIFALRKIDPRAAATVER